MRISNRLFGLLAGSALMAFTASGAYAESVAFSSPREALRQGLSAYQGGYFEIAIPALQSAADSGDVQAQYYLARIYSDSNSAHSGRAKAYYLFRDIANEHADADPEDDPNAPYVGKSLTALASYVRSGIPEIGLAPDPRRAIIYLRNASTTFDDEDAQFELAKLMLVGEGFEPDEALGRHWLSTLSERGHAGAQAYLADLLWKGKYMAPDKPRALALIAIAVENAPVYERLWIEDLYQNIYCGTGDRIRHAATGIITGWGNRYGRKPLSKAGPVIGVPERGPERECRDGQDVQPLRSQELPLKQPDSQEPEEPLFGPLIGPRRGSLEASVPDEPRSGSGSAPGFAFGSASGPTLRDVGAGFAEPPRSGP